MSAQQLWFCFKPGKPRNKTFFFVVKILAVPWMGPELNSLGQGHWHLLLLISGPTVSSPASYRQVKNESFNNCTNVSVSLSQFYNQCTRTKDKRNKLKREDVGLSVIKRHWKCSLLKNNWKTTAWVPVYIALTQNSWKCIENEFKQIKISRNWSFQSTIWYITYSDLHIY